MFVVETHVRIPISIHEQLVKSAKENQRSLNKEIVHRLMLSAQGYAR